MKTATKNGILHIIAPLPEIETSLVLLYNQQKVNQTDYENFDFIVALSNLQTALYQFRKLAILKGEPIPATTIESAARAWVNENYDPSDITADLISAYEAGARLK